MKAKKTKKKKATRKSHKTQGNGKVRGVRGKSGLTVCQTWIKCFENKAITTADQCTKAMLKEFPGRESAIFHVPNVVIGRCAKGLLDGKKHTFAKYPVDGKKKKAS